MTAFEGFPEDFFRFFDDLRKNNERAWFNEHKARYVASVVEPTQAFIVAVAPLLHGLLAFGLGYLAPLLTGFSPGGVILLAVIAGSSSDISGPPTLRAAIPSANPSAYIGASTSIGTPVAIAVGIPLYIALGEAVFGF